MPDSDLRRALWATARVAGLTALIGCAPQVGVVIPQTSPANTQDVPEPEPEPECADLLIDLVADFSEGEDVSGSDGAVVECCEEIVQDVDASGEWPQDADAQMALSACCAALDYPESLACTPWGPPSPPAMAVA